MDLYLTISIDNNGTQFFISIPGPITIAKQAEGNMMLKDLHSIKLHSRGEGGTLPIM